MRNLKRVLSLALAVVMVIGMMVMGTSAADYADADEISRNEAVDVMSALKVLEGDGTNFHPGDILTREEATTIITKMLMGPENAKLLTGTTAFTDVEADRWSAPYIGYCASLKILAGNGDGTFDPEGKLTGVAFAKMLLCALGYDAAVEGYTGDNWATNIGSDAIEVGLNITGVSLDDDVTRENAAQMALQAMTKTMVTYNGMAAYFGFAEAEPVAQGDIYEDVYGNTTLQLSEKLFPELKRTTGDPDKFGRPSAYKWYIDADLDDGGYNRLADTVVYNASKKVAYTYDVTGQNDTTLAQIAAKLELDIDGATMATAEKGDTVELYLNTDGEISNAVKLHTDLAVITKVVENTDKDAKFNYTVSMKIDNNAASYTDKELTGFDVDTMVKDTYITIVETEVDGNTAAVVALADSITGKKTAEGTGYIKIDGVKKFVAGDTWAVDGLNYNDTFNFYLDAKGLVIGHDKVTSAPAKTNIFYINNDKFENGGTWGTDSAKLSVVYLDGTSEILDMVITVVEGTKTVKVDGEDTALTDLDAEGDLTNGFYAYTLNDDGDVKSIKAVGTSGSAADGVKDTIELIDEDDYVTFTEDEIVVDVNNEVDLFATSATKVVVIDPTTKSAVTVSGYKVSEDTTYTVGDDVTDVTAILYTYSNDVLNTVYVLGATVTVSDDAVNGWFVSMGDTWYDAKDDETYTEVVYNVGGEDKAYTIVASDFDEDEHKQLVSIVVTDGIAALADATSIDDVEKVTDTYIVIDGGAVEFANSVAYYDVTNVAKNGVVADDAVVVGDIITCTYDRMGKITAIYTTYAAQDDGTLAKNDATYLEEVIGFNSTDSANAANPANKDWVVIQYTRPQNMSTGNVLTVKSAAGTTVYTETNSIITAGIGGFMIDPNGSNTNGDLALTVGDTYTYTIACDGVIVCTGSFTVK